MAYGRYPFETGPEMDLAAARQPVRSSLYLRLMDLLASARMGRLDIEALAERGVHLQMDRLLGAAEPFWLTDGVQLRDCLFIGPGALSGAFWKAIGARAHRDFSCWSWSRQQTLAPCIYVQAGGLIFAMVSADRLPTRCRWVKDHIWRWYALSSIGWAPRSRDLLPWYRSGAVTSSRPSPAVTRGTCWIAWPQSWSVSIVTARRCRLLASLALWVRYRSLPAVCAAMGSGKSSRSSACPALPIVPSRASWFRLAVKGCRISPGRQALTTYVPILPDLPCDADRRCARQPCSVPGAVSCQESRNKDARALLGESSPDSSFYDSEPQKARFIVLLSESL